MNQSPSNQTLNSVQDDDKIDIAQYLDLVFENRWLIAAVTLVVTLAGAAYAFMATPVYEANILVQVEDSASSSTNIMGELAGAFDLKSAATAEMEILRSRFVVGRAVRNAKLDLVVEPAYFPIVGRWISRRSNGLSAPGIFGYGGYVWGNEAVNVSVFNVPEVLEREPFVLTATGKDSFRLTQADANIEIAGQVGTAVKAITKQGTVEILVEGLNAKSGARFNVSRVPFLDTLEDLQKSLNISERGKQSGVIGVALEGINPQKTADTLNEIGNEYIRQNVERKSAEAEKSLAFLEGQLPQMKSNLEDAESRYNALRNSRGTVDLGEEAKSILQQSVLSQTRLIELKQKRDELLTRYQDSNPLVAAVTQQMKTLNDEIENVNKKIKTMPSIEQDVLRLTRDVKVNTDLYTSLLNSAQQLRLLKASKVGNARLLDKAVAPLHPIRPKRAVITGLALVAGLFLGAVCALIRKSLFGGIEDPHEIEQLLGLTVSAAIPFSERQTTLFSGVQAKTKKISVLAVDDPTDGAIESLRSFRTSLQFTMLRAKSKAIMITGPTPGVGKSFVSVNFTAVLASNNKKVLLIDADIRKGYLNNYFGLDRKGGLSEVIAGTLSFEQAVHRNVIENVDFISTGILPPQPAELLGHENFEAMLQKISPDYDFIVIDTAPILAVSDALVVAPHVAAIFNVVRYNVSTIGEIEESVKRLNQTGKKIDGLVFNGLKAQVGRYGIGSKYGKYKYMHYKY